MLDPRTKLLLALAYGTLIALTRRPEWLLAEWALLVAAIVVMNRWKAYLRWLAMLVPMALFFGGVTWWSTDRATGQSRGFGFVEMADDEAVRAAIAELNGQDLDGRPLKVSEAYDRPRPDRGASRSGMR